MSDECKESRERIRVTTDIHRASPRKLNWSVELQSTVAQPEPELKVDLRIEGTAQDVILKDEEPMRQRPRSSGKTNKWPTHETYSGEIWKTSRTTLMRATSVRLTPGRIIR